MMNLAVPDLKDPISLDSFKRKLVSFNLNGKFYTNQIYSELTKHIKVRIHEDGRNEAYIWCEANFGDKWIWSNPTQTEYVEIYFVHEDDALMFKLRFTPLDA